MKSRPRERGHDPHTAPAVDGHSADAAGHVADQAADQRGARPASGSPAAAHAAPGDEQREQRGQHAQVLTMQVNGGSGVWRGIPCNTATKQNPPPLLLALASFS